MGTNNYIGVHMTVNNTGGIDVWDGQPTGTSKLITVFELIGQPTWIDVGLVQFITVMRGDIKPSDVVYLPKNIPYNIGPDNTAIQHPPQRTELSFTGAFQVYKVTHNGDFRNPDGTLWSTAYECYYLSGAELARMMNIPNPFAPSFVDPTIPFQIPPGAPGNPLPQAQASLSQGQTPSRLLSRPVRRM
jgi:hypothetical protein